MTDCKYYHDGICEIASKLADRPARIEDPRTCDKCKRQSVPMAANHMTASVALAAITDKQERKEYARRLRSYIPVVRSYGPGQELTRILHRVGFRPLAGCKCSEHAKTMDKKGVQWCKDNLDTIVTWLEEEAQRRGFGVIFSRLGARQIVLLAIWNAERQQKKRQRRERREARS